MTVRISLNGSKAIQAAIRAAGDDVRAAARKAVIGTAMELEGDIKKSIRHPGTGRTYQKYNPRRVHTASRPGMPPASDTGRLLNSIRWDQVGDLTATVGAGAVYGLYLEYGTIKMAARPFFRPAVERMRAKFEARIERAFLDNAGIFARGKYRIRKATGL